MKGSAMKLSDLRKDYKEKKERYDAYAKEAGTGEDFDISKLSIEGTTETEKADNYKQFLEDLGDSRNALDNAVALERSTVEAMQVAPRRGSRGADYVPAKEQFMTGVGDAVKEGVNGMFHHRHTFENPADMKAAFVTGGGSVRPEDTVISPAIYPTLVLDAMNITMTENNTIVFHQPNRQAVAGRTKSNQNVAAPRFASGQIAESERLYNRVVVPIESLGIWQPIARETLQDHQRFGTVALETLLEDLRRAMVQQILAGTGTSPAWIGFLAASGGVTPSNYSTIAAGTSSAPALNIYDNLRYHVIDMFSQGIAVSAIIADAAAVDKCITAMEAKPFDLEDRNRGVFGSVMSVPLIPSALMQANTILMGPFTTRSEVAMRGDIEVATSEDARFTRNEIALRALVQGNVGLWAPDEFRGIRNTNNYIAHLGDTEYGTR